MERIVKKVLNTIEKNGFEAYVIGGYVRDLMLSKHSWDVDICTNALPRDLIMLFPNANVGIYGAIDFKIGKLSFEITTYRKEYDYEKRHPCKIEYINNLIEDIQRRDFTVNTICMNQKGTIIDFLGASQDIANHIISSVGDANKKILEDPLRMLRAIRFATTLNFTIDSHLKESIANHKEEIIKLSDSRIIDELTKILISDNYNKGLSLLKELGLADVLKISYNDVVKTKDVNGMWAQLDIKKSLAFNKETIHNINTIKKIIELGRIDNHVVYEYGLYLSMVAGEVLGVENKQVAYLFSKLPIKNRKDLKTTPEQIMALLDISEGASLGNIITDLEDAVLSKRISNNSKEIIDYLIKKYKGDTDGKKKGTI